MTDAREGPRGGDVISHDPDAPRSLSAAVGADGVAPGTDGGLDVGRERPREVVTATALGLSRRDQARVIRDDAARRLRLA